MIRRRKGLRFRWSIVINFYRCRLFGHRMVAPDGQWFYRTCARCAWAPTEAPEPGCPVAGFGGGWWSLLPLKRINRPMHLCGRYRAPKAST